MKGLLHEKNVHMGEGYNFFTQGFTQAKGKHNKLWNWIIRAFSGAPQWILVLDQGTDLLYLIIRKYMPDPYETFC